MFVSQQTCFSAGIHNFGMHPFIHLKIHSMYRKIYKFFPIKKILNSGQLVSRLIKTCACIVRVFFGKSRFREGPSGLVSSRAHLHFTAPAAVRHRLKLSEAICPIPRPWSQTPKPDEFQLQVKWKDNYVVDIHLDSQFYCFILAKAAHVFCGFLT